VNSQGSEVTDHRAKYPARGCAVGSGTALQAKGGGFGSWKSH